LIIIGEEYKFNKIDLEKLKKYTIVYIPYNSSSATEIIRNIKEFIYRSNDKIIVINTLETLDSQLKHYLDTLKEQKFKIIFIDEFLEKHLQKVLLSLNITKNIKPLNKWQFFQKRVIDYLVTIPLAIFSAPIILYSMHRIKKESPDAGAYFSQIRVGINGKPFECLKLRSMRTDVEYFNHYTQDKDPRIFKYGEFIRKTRIDELPQLLNILRGDMHIIGPRAEWIDLVKQYEEKLPNYHRRHLIKPGITGWAQVNYPYGRDLEDTRQKLMYDLYYIKHWSILLELKIVYKTALVVFGKKGL